MKPGAVQEIVGVVPGVTSSGRPGTGLQSGSIVVRVGRDSHRQADEACGFSPASLTSDESQTKITACVRHGGSVQCSSSQARQLC